MMMHPAVRRLERFLTRNIDGAQGIASQIVAQLEGAWLLGHEDAEDLVLANVIGTTNFGSFNLPVWTEHGTACFGLINATRNAYGMIGFAPLARGRVCSLANGEANMISLATAAAAAGDVFTSSFAYVANNNRHAPVDWPQANFDAIKTASRRPVEPTLASELVADLGFDSLQVLDLIAELESRFDISIPLDDAPTARTVEQVVAQVAQLVEAQGAAD